MQPLRQRRVALPVRDAFDGQPNGLGWSDEDGELFRSCESGVNACVILRRNNFDPPLSYSFSYSQLTTSKIHAQVCSATQQMDAATPPCGRSSPPGRSVVDGRRRDERTRDIPQSLLCALVSSAKPTTGIQVVRPAAPTASTRSLLMPTEQGLSTPGQHDALLANASEARARVR
jgi:hypothetical protein